MLLYKKTVAHDFRYDPRTITAAMRKFVLYILPSVLYFLVPSSQKIPIASLKSKPFSVRYELRFIYGHIILSDKSSRASFGFALRQDALLQYSVSRGTSNLAQRTIVMFLQHFQNRGSASFDTRIRVTQHRRCTPNFMSELR